MIYAIKMKDVNPSLLKSHLGTSMVIRNCKISHLMNSTFMRKGIGTDNSFMRLYVKSTVFLYLKLLAIFHKKFQFVRNGKGTRKSVKTLNCTLYSLM